MRIALQVADPLRREALRALIVEAGHEYVESPAAAEVVVCDAELAHAGFAAESEAELEALLTPREAEVLELLAGGLGNKEIARRLAISPHTVKFHLEALYRKLGVRTRTEAAARLWQRRRQTLEI